MPSKHQLKKEKQAARKNRKNHRNSSINKSSNDDTIGENETTHADSEESDADVEDNIENEGPQEVIESGYSSEKPSNVASPVSAGEPSDLNPSLPKSNGNVPSSTDISNSLELNIEVPSAPAEALTSLPVSQLPSELSPGTTVSPLSSPMTSKESPASPASSGQDSLMWKIVINDGHADTKADDHQKTTFSGAETDECRSGTEADDTIKVCCNNKDPPASPISFLRCR